MPEEHDGPPADRPRPPNTATVSSLKSEDSTERLIVKPIKSVRDSVTCKSVERGDGVPARKKLVVLLGLAQMALGALLAGAGGLALARGAALARSGAGLWAGAVAALAGAVGLLAGVHDCLANPNAQRGGASGQLSTAFLALSLLSVATGNGAAALAAAGLQRDLRRARTPPALPSFQDEMEAWSPVLANIGVLVVAAVHCLVGVLSVCVLARRACSCLRARAPFKHNTFDARALQPYDDDKLHAHDTVDGLKSQELCKDLEGKLSGENGKKKKQDETPEYGSANSKEKLVTRWLGHASSAPAPVAAPAPMALPVVVPVGARCRRGLRKAARKPPPVMLVPAHPASTLGRGPPPLVPLAARYATLPLPPPYPPHVAHPHAHAHLYYQMPDGRLRRRVSPRDGRGRRRRGERPRGPRDDRLTRSLERIHRQRREREQRPSDADLKQTYTGLDRAYAEQFIAVCDESRLAHDSLPSTATSHSSDTEHTP